MNGRIDEKVGAELRYPYNLIFEHKLIFEKPELSFRP